MNKAELIDSISSKSGLPKTDSKRILEAFVASVEEELSNGGKVSLVGFGTFSVKRREEREGRNPQTGAVIKIAAKNVVKFKAGSDLSSKV